MQRMITARAGQPASVTPPHRALSAMLPSGRSNRLAIAAARPSAFTIHAPEATCISKSAAAHAAGMRWLCGVTCNDQCGQLPSGGKRRSNWVAPAHQLSKAACATAAPPYAHVSMTALPSSFSRRCSCACAGISSMGQYSYTMARRELHGELRVYVARGVQIAGVGAPQLGPNRP